MTLVCVHHVYWWFSTAYGIYIHSVSGNRISSQISYIMIYSGSKSSTHDTHSQCLCHCTKCTYSYEAVFDVAILLTH